MGRGAKQAQFKMRLTPLTLKQANDVIAKWHRHNLPVRGHRFSIGLMLDSEIIGCAVVGRPTARGFDQYTVAEVTRLCVDEEHAPKGACSKLYGASWRAWKAMGGLKIVTYTLQSESGASLSGAGWRRDKELDSRDQREWMTRPNRKAQAVVGLPKIRWCCP